jgi:mRNA interferase RelE/StbE
MYSVEYSKQAAKALQKLDRNTAAILYGWIEKNLNGCSNPRLHGKALTSDKKGYWRYRVGSYRIIADILDNLVKIEIINIAHRREVYDE